MAVLKSGKLQLAPYYYIDMELCDFSLQNYIDGIDVPMICGQQYHLATGSAEMEFLRLVNIMNQVAKGLDFIHGNGEVHRDIKPSNSIVPL